MPSCSGAVRAWRAWGSTDTSGMGGAGSGRELHRHLQKGGLHEQLRLKQRECERERDRQREEGRERARVCRVAAAVFGHIGNENQIQRILSQATLTCMKMGGYRTNPKDSRNPNFCVGCFELIISENFATASKMGKNILFLRFWLIHFVATARDRAYLGLWDCSPFLHRHANVDQLDSGIAVHSTDKHQQEQFRSTKFSTSQFQLIHNSAHGT